MVSRLSMAERGIWGRQATDEERRRLKEFVDEFRKQDKARRSNDAEKLQEILREYSGVLVSPQPLPRRAGVRRFGRGGMIDVTQPRQGKRKSFKIA